MNIEQQIETIQARIAELETMIRPLADEAARLRYMRGASLHETNSYFIRMSCPRCGGLPGGEASGALDICECEPMYDPFLCWRQKIAILSAALRQAGTALENAFPIVKAHAVASADEDRYDDLVGEVSRAIEAINQLKL